MTTAIAAAEKLRSAGINVDPYQRGPAGSDVFMLSMQEHGTGVIRIWPGIADLEIHTDKRRCQAVIVATEKRRKIQRKVEFSVYDSSIRQASDLESRARNVFNVNVPRTATFEVTDLVVVRSEPVNLRTFYTATVTATIPRSVQTFLVGKDSEYHFISVLPKKVGSVREAHDALRPKNVPEGSPRQGEWFFVPCTEEQKTAIEKKIASGTIPGHEYLYKTPRSWDETHMATLAIDVRGVQYVCGYIMDDRRHRSAVPHHEPLWLNDWHRPVQNLEQPATDVRGRSQNYD